MLAAATYRIMRYSYRLRSDSNMWQRKIWQDELRSHPRSHVIVRDGELYETHNLAGSESPNEEV